MELCDRAILLDHGELLTEGSPKKVVSSYQKLLYAPADRVHGIREAIRQGSDLGSRKVRAKEPVSEDNAPHLPTVKDGAELDPEAYWIEGLDPVSTVRYENRGAAIEDPHLETVDGRRVNVLAPGRTYVYTFKVRVERALARVRCGMMIRSMTGVDVGGAATSLPQQAFELVESGAMLNVSFSFRCSLGTGTYFLNAGLLAGLGEGEEYIDRVMDAAMFRVLPDTNRVATGFVDFDVVPALTVDL